MVGKIKRDERGGGGKKVQNGIGQLVSAPAPHQARHDRISGGGSSQETTQRVGKEVNPDEPRGISGGGRPTAVRKKGT